MADQRTNPTENFRGPKEERADRCDQLARHFPGLEELRMRKDGSIISRHWTLIADGNAPRWAIARAKNDPPDGWSPKPGLANLKFLPPLEPKLKDGASQYLAYAPLLGENFDEVQKLGTINEVFGDAQGTFDWRGRKYGYALTSKLPCYPILQ